MPTQFPSAKDAVSQDEEDELVDAARGSGEGQ